MLSRETRPRCRLVLLERAVFQEPAREELPWKALKRARPEWWRRPLVLVWDASGAAQGSRGRQPSQPASDNRAPFRRTPATVERKCDRAKGSRPLRLFREAEFPRSR